LSVRNAGPQSLYLLYSFIEVQMSILAITNDEPAIFLNLDLYSRF
jgi:hypothetical protein